MPYAMYQKVYPRKGERMGKKIFKKQWLKIPQI
jgi:hypothetical protein